MLQTNAVFHRKEASFEHELCNINRVIRLSGAEYDRFAGNLFAEQDFIRDNQDLMVYADGARGCLLVTGEGRSDGILVDSSGYDYARYAAYVPNAEGLLTTERYPALAGLNNKLADITDYIAGQATAGDRAVVDLQDVEAEFGIDLMTNGVLRQTVFDMLDGRPEIADFEVDKNEIVLYGLQGQEHSRTEEKPSVLEQLRSARQSSFVPDPFDKVLPFEEFVSKCGMLDESCRQWCDGIDDAPERRDGKDFTKFHSEICEQKYQEYLNDPVYRADCNHLAGKKDKAVKRGKEGPEL